MSNEVTVNGGGLAGSEAAWSLARAGMRVRLFEMRPQQSTEAHTGGDLAELVCSNSFRGRRLHQAPGVLKEEMKLLGSIVMTAAAESEVPAGGAMAVDRERFAAASDRLDGQGHAVPAW